MSKISLKIVVAGRTYPLHVNEGEERKVQRAAEEINQSIKLLQENYAVKDMQDLLAMTALQLASKANSPGSKVVQDYDEIEDALDGLIKDLNDLK